jgi:hypothetical protein
VIQQDERAALRRLSDVSRAHPGDMTLQNLLGVLSAKLDSCRRLPIFEYEAGNEGQHATAEAFHALAIAERASIDQLLVCLEQHLSERNGVRQ